MATKKEKERAALLHHVVTETKGEKGFATVKLDDHLKQLVTEKKVEVDPKGPDASGLIAARATADVIAAPPAPPAPVVEVPKPVITLQTVFLPPAPESARRKKDDLYPFATMEINQSFVIPTAPGMEDPYKFMSAKVGGFMRKTSVNDPSGKTKLNRKKEPVPVKVATRKFEVRAVKQGDQYPDGFVEPVTGARIYRTA